jgi:hypothetical protein
VADVIVSIKLDSWLSILLILLFISSASFSLPLDESSSE